MKQQASWLAQDWGIIVCIWRREMIKMVRERARMVGQVGQPLLFWLFIGNGMADSFSVSASGDGPSALTYFFPGMLAAVILFTTLFATITVVDDRQQGFMQSVLVAPGSRLALVLGEVAGVTTQVFIQVTLFLAIAPLVGFSLPEVNWLALAAVVFVASVGLTAMNYSVAWWVDSQRGYHAIMMIALLPLWFLSGALFPPPDNWLRYLMLANPVAHACDGIRGALSADALGVSGVLGSSPNPVFESIAVLCVFAVVMLFVATRASRRPESA